LPDFLSGGFSQTKRLSQNIRNRGDMNIMGNLSGKVALVTGAANKKSMGRGIAVRLASDGAKVAVVDKYSKPESIWPGDEDWGGLATVVEEIKSVGSEGLAIEADISNASEADRIVSQTIAKFAKIDILVQCVGVRGPVPVPIVDLDEKTWRMLLDVNLTGTFLISKAIAKTMIPNGDGPHENSGGGTRTL
jgi:NAD(P)-dependent dehydrogenase (short-subunit alcohol dehydrogenase family)